MENLADALAVFFSPLYKLLTVPEDRIYWAYFLSAYALGLLAILKSQRVRNFSGILASLKRLFPKRVFLHPSALADYKMLFVNNFSYFYVLPLIIVGSGAVADGVLGQLRAATGSETFGLEPSGASRVALTLIGLLAWDFGFFFAHYLQHKVPWLWEFHKTHHSAEVLTPATVFRMHPVDDFLTISMVALMVGLVEGIFAFLFADPVTAYLIYGINVFWFLFLVFGYHLRHSHVWILFPKPIRYVISSPALHQIHHSDNPKHFDKNFARIFLFWDQLAGTLYLPEGHEEIRFGLGGGEHREFDSLWKLYALPFKKVAQRWLWPRTSSSSRN